MKFFRLVIVLATAAAPLTACAPYVGSCTWVVPAVSAGLTVIEPRKAIADECNCINCGAPGRFRITRDDYTVELWNGDRWYAEFYLRARSKDGATLTLISDAPDFYAMGKDVPPAATHGFDYFLRVEKVDGSGFLKMIRVKVVGPDGGLLGTEDIRLDVETRKDVGFESI